MAIQIFQGGRLEQFCGCADGTAVCSTGSQEDCNNGAGPCPPDEVCTYSDYSPTVPPPICGCGPRL